MCMSKPKEPKIIQTQPTTFQYMPEPTTTNRQQVTAAAVEDDSAPKTQGASLGAGGTKMKETS